MLSLYELENCRVDMFLQDHVDLHAHFGNEHALQSAFEIHEHI